MKLYVLMSLLCFVSFVEPKSLDFSSFFPFNAYKTDAAPTAPSNKLQDSEPSLQTLTSSEYLELNVSGVSSHESNESVAMDNIFSESSSSMDNSTDLLNATEVSAQAQSSTKSKLNSSPTPTSNSSGSSEMSFSSSLDNIFNSTEETEEVVLNTPTFTVVTKTIYEKTIEWVGDTYILSILIPIAGGVLFAVSIILTVATCRCLRRKCRRRKFRKRVLPDSIKNLRPSDQARLLGDCDSSDEF